VRAGWAHAPPAVGFGASMSSGAPASVVEEKSEASLPSLAPPAVTLTFFRLLRAKIDALQDQCPDTSAGAQRASCSGRVLTVSLRRAAAAAAGGASVPRVSMVSRSRELRWLARRLPSSLPPEAYGSQKDADAGRNLAVLASRAERCGPWLLGSLRTRVVLTRGPGLAGGTVAGLGTTGPSVRWAPLTRTRARARAATDMCAQAPGWCAIVQGDRLSGLLALTEQVEAALRCCQRAG
jgi:hypothetical protein